MDESLIGKWVEITLVNGKVWTGKLEEWDEEAIFVTNGIDFGGEGFKGAECANNEVDKVVETTLKEFNVK